LFLDEPTSGVDPVSRERVWELIQDLSSDGVTVFVTTHYMDEAEYCNRLGLINHGRLIALGTPAELKLDSVRGEILLVEAEPLSRAFELLKQSTALVRDAAVFGNSLHLVVDSYGEAAPRVRATLEENGVTIHRIVAINPSLEDAFVALTGRPHEPGLGV
jgi:ABC-2 type transport system ATP-binding protein